MTAFQDGISSIDSPGKVVCIDPYFSIDVTCSSCTIIVFLVVPAIIIILCIIIKISVSKLLNDAFIYVLGACLKARRVILN
jgi:hypothetical protein